MHRTPSRDAPRRASVTVSAAALCAVLLAVLLTKPGCGAATAAPPHVLLVVVDTLRADHCSFLGYPRPTTPRMESFAADAVVYTDTWTSSSWTFPSHASLFTGLCRTRHRTGIDLPHRLDARWPTVAEGLRDAGYDTASFSANPFVTEAFGLTRGFAHVEPLERPGRHAPADEVVTQATAHLRRQLAAGRRTFTFVNLMECHVPNDPPPEVSERFRTSPRDAREDHLRRISQPEVNLMGLRGNGPSADDLRRWTDLYDAEIAVADAAVGRLLDAWRDAGILDETLVVLTSDHGEGLGDHRWMEHTTMLHRNLLRVPLVVRLPGRFDGGRRVTALRRLEDVAATLWDATGAPPPAGLDGRVLDAPEEPGRTAAAIEIGAPRMAEQAARLAPDAPPELLSALAADRVSVYDGRWHLVEADDGAVDLHDTLTDPGERRNRKDDAPEELARLRALLPRTPDGVRPPETPR